VNGGMTLVREPIAIKQVAVADRIVLTKSDLLAAGEPSVAPEIAQLNPRAPLLTAQHGRIDPHRLFDAGLYDPLTKPVDVQSELLADTPPHSGHGDAIQSYTIVRERPIRAVTLTLLIETLAQHCGGDLLRLKGIIDVAESPDRPAVIHGVQHVFHAPVFLARWPSADRRSRIVIIARAVPRRWIEALIEALEAEVAEVANARADIVNC
jgi:G3E family GTPase